MSQAKDFWEEWAKLGQDLLDYGQRVQFGNSFIEVKFQKGVPSVIMQSKSIMTKHADNNAAKQAVGQILDQSEASGFHGARTFTIAYTNGQIAHILLDEYGSDLLY